MDKTTAQLLKTIILDGKITTDSKRAASALRALEADGFVIVSQPLDDMPHILRGTLSPELTRGE